VAFKVNVCADGQVIVGGVLSTGVTKKVHVDALPDASVAVIVTVVAAVILVPAAGACVMVIEPDAVQLSVALVNET
jgi:hypothetical protein